MKTEVVNFIQKFFIVYFLMRLTSVISNLLLICYFNFKTFVIKFHLLFFMWPSDLRIKLLLFLVGIYNFFKIYSYFLLYTSLLCEDKVEKCDKGYPCDCLGITER